MVKPLLAKIGKVDSINHAAGIGRLQSAQVSDDVEANRKLLVGLQ